MARSVGLPLRDFGGLGGSSSLWRGSHVKPKSNSVMIKKNRFVLLALAAFSALSSGALAQGSGVDLTAASTAVTSNLSAAQGLALPIFGIMFGGGMALMFFKKMTK